MKKTQWLLLATFSVTAIAGLLLFKVSRAASDAEMISQFNGNRATFDQLVQMFVADDQDMWLSASGQSWVGRATSTGVSTDRWLEYLGLMWRTGLTGVGVGGVRLKGEPIRIVGFDANVPLFGYPAKAFVYSEDPLPQLTNGNTDTYQFPNGATRAVCRAIDINWYICLNYED